MNCPSCTYENPEGIDKCLICGADMIPTPEIQAPPPPQLGTAAAQQQAQPLQQAAQAPPAAPAPPATQGAPAAPAAQAAPPAQPAPAGQAAPATPEAGKSATPAQPTSPAPPAAAPPQAPQATEPALPDPRKLKTKSKTSHDTIRIISGIFWIILGIFATLIGIFSTLAASGHDSLTRPTIEYSTSVPWIMIGFLSFPVAFNLLLLKKKLGNVSLIIGAIPMVLIIILVFSIMYSTFTGWAPIVIGYLFLKGFILMAGYIVFFILLFIGKSLNDKLEFEQEQEYLTQTQDYSQYSTSQYSMSIDKIMNPDYVNPSIEMKMIAVAVMFMIAAVITPIFIINSDIAVNSGFYSTSSTSSSFPTIEVSLTDNGDATNDQMNVRHMAGEDLDWSDYKIIITSVADDTKKSTLNDLSSLGTINNSQSSIIDAEIEGFSDVDYLEGEYYQIEIYLKDGNKRVYNKPLCNCGS
jgi:hypothetical protein